MHNDVFFFNACQIKLTPKKYLTVYDQNILMSFESDELCYFTYTVCQHFAPPMHKLPHEEPDLTLIHYNFTPIYHFIGFSIKGLPE